MEVRRFRWWADEAAAVEEEEREVERRMAAKRRKRSVAELFAAVPRVAGGKKGKGAVNGMQAKKGKMVVVPVPDNGSKGLNKKRKVPIGTDLRNKEKSGNIKTASISMLQDSMRMRKLTKSLGKDKRIQEASILPNKKSKKTNNNSFSDSKKNAIKNSVQDQSILHKQSKVGFSTLKDNTDVTRKLNSSGKPKHVTFSNDIFGWTAPLPVNNTVQPQSVQTSQRPSLEGHDKCSVNELQLVYQQGDAIPGAIEEDTSSLTEIVVSAGVNCAFPAAKPKERSIVGNSVDRKQRTEISNSSNNLNSISLACSSSKMPSQNFDGVDPHLDNDEDFSLNAECLGVGEESHVPQGPVSLAAKAVSGDIYRSLLSQPFSSSLDDRRRSTLLERMTSNHHLGKVQPKFVSYGKDEMNSIITSPGSKKSSDARAKDCVPACRNKYFGNNDYTGLPLNSRGEFVKLHPGGTPNSINILKRQYLGESSSHPSTFPTFYNPTTCTDHFNYRPDHHVPNIHSTDQSPHFTPRATTEYEMNFRQLPYSERIETDKQAIRSNKCPCTNQQELSAVCFCSEFMECHNPQQKQLGVQRSFTRQDCEQNTQPTAETTMRLMGKTVALGTSSPQFRYLNIESPGSCKQTQAEDRSFPGTGRKAFPQLFHREIVDPPSAFRIPHGERELSENPSLLPAAELRSEFDTNGFRANGYSQQPELTAANNLYVQSATWCNKGELRYQQAVMPNQVHRSAENMLSVSMHRRNNQNVASVPSFNRRNSLKDFMEKRPAPYQPGYFTQKLMTQRNPMSSSMSGHAAIQSTPSVTTQTKFTSLPPLPPSLAPSHVRNLDYAQHRGSNTTTFHPSIPAAFQTGRSSAPGNAMSKDERLKWAIMASNVEGSGHVLNGNGKRPAEKDDAFLRSPKKPCTAARKDDLNLLPIPEKGVQFCGSSRTDAPAVDMPVGFGPEARSDLRLGSRDAHTTWSYPVSTMRPVKLKSGARHILQPSGSSMGQAISWTVNSVTPYAVENAAAASTSKNRDTESYKY